MKKILCFVLVVTLLFSGCRPLLSEQSTTPAEPSEFTVENCIPDFETYDVATLQYIDDEIYAGVTAELQSDDYRIESVKSIYISQEYLDELAFNSQSNVYFGYTLSELDELFQGTRYVFTVGEDGQTIVQEMQSIEDTFPVEALQNLAIGAGVILVCLTVSVATAGAGAPTVSVIFQTAATEAFIEGLAKGLTSVLLAAIITAREKDDPEAIMRAALDAGSEAFKWGAIEGAIEGSIKGSFKQIWNHLTNKQTIPSYLQSEKDAQTLYPNSKPQLAYANGDRVSSNTQGSTRPDLVIENADGTIKAIEVKNYNLKSAKGVASLISELKKQIEDRVNNLPEGSTQEIVLDVRGRGYTKNYVDGIIEKIQKELWHIYPQIPVMVMQ